VARIAPRSRIIPSNPISMAQADSEAVHEGRGKDIVVRPTEAVKPRAARAVLPTRDVSLENGRRIIPVVVIMPE
jgi:hypothetical protein